MLTNDTIRSFVISHRSLVIDLMITENAKWYGFLGRFLRKRRLEKLSDDALVEQFKAQAPAPAKALVPELSSLSVDRFKSPLFDKLGPSHLEVRSSAPYSEGSSDQAMLSSPSPDPWKR